VIVPVDIVDNDDPGFTVSKNAAIVSEDGTTLDSFTVVLNAQPMSDVVISVDSSNPNEVIMDPAELIFTKHDWDLVQTVQLVGVADQTVDGDQTSTVTVKVITDRSFDPFDDLSPQTVSVTTTDVDQPDKDFGDAPTASQSGFANDYPVTLDQDGARHIAGSLKLGNAIDVEPNGQPDADAGLSGGGDDNGNDDEDGVFFNSIVTIADASTSSSISVFASGSGKVDAWIDFNQDGIWTDIEQILDSVDVTAGPNLLGFNVPAGASAGATGARFRLSSDGGLGPTGEAVDGEVEDYMVTLFDGATGPVVALGLISEATIALGSDRITVQSGAIDLFGAPAQSVGSLSILGTTHSDSLTIDTTAGVTIPAGGLRLMGGSGENKLVILGDGPALDLTDPRVHVENLSYLDLSDTDANAVSLDALGIAEMSPAARRVTVSAGEADRIVLKDAQDWRMSDPVTADGVFWVTANNQLAGGSESVQADLPYPWQNFVRPGDINNDGSTTALDALRIINELGQRLYSDATTFDLNDPTGLSEWPGVYFDKSGDGKVTGLDALQVINVLGQQNNRESGEAELAVTRALFAPESKKDESESNVEVRVDTLAIDSVLSVLGFHDDSDTVTISDAQTPAEDVGSVRDETSRAVDELLTEDSIFAQLLG
jgi:hypothetical protein